jgi:hypothetical protein
MDDSGVAVTAASVRSLASSSLWPCSSSLQELELMRVSMEAVEELVRCAAALPALQYYMPT